MVFWGGALTGPYPTLQFDGACGLGVGAHHLPALILGFFGGKNKFDQEETRLAMVSVPESNFFKRKA